MQTPFTTESSVNQQRPSLGKPVSQPSAGGRRSPSKPLYYRAWYHLLGRLLEIQHGKWCAESTIPSPPLASGCLSHALSAVPAVCAPFQLPLLTSEPELHFFANSAACSVLRQACRDTRQGLQLLIQTAASISDPASCNWGCCCNCKCCPRNRCQSSARATPPSRSSQ